MSGRRQCFRRPYTVDDDVTGCGRVQIGVIDGLAVRGLAQTPEIRPETPYPAFSSAATSAELPSWFGDERRSAAAAVPIVSGARATTG